MTILWSIGSDIMRADGLQYLALTCALCYMIAHRSEHDGTSSDAADRSARIHCYHFVAFAR